MYSIQLQWLVFSIFLINSIYGKNAGCDYEDVDCMTKGANHAHKYLMAGVEGKAETTDPLHYDKFDGGKSGFIYKFTDIVMTGMGNCKVTLLKCNKTVSSVEYNWRCPKLVTNTHFKFKGPLGPFEFNGQGKIKITIDDYIIFYKSKFMISIDESDHTPRVSLYDLDVDTDVKGRVTYETDDDLIAGDKAKSEQAKKYLNNNWRELQKIIKRPNMIDLLKKALRNISDTLKTYHIGELDNKD